MDGDQAPLKVFGVQSEDREGDFLPQYDMNVQPRDMNYKSAQKTIEFPITQEMSPINQDAWM